MPEKEVTYGVAWRTVLSQEPTSVWFKDRQGRKNFIKADLRKKVLVLQDSITLFIKGTDGKVTKDTKE